MLQEMDASWFAEHWEPVMATRGYEGHFTKKRHPGSSEGLATFVRTAAFEVVEARPLALSLAADDQAPAALSPLLATHESTAEGMSKLPSVAQLLLLREVAPDMAATRDPAPPVSAAPTSAAPTSAAPRHLLVANTHLYFSNPGMHVRLMQTAKILDHAHRWAAEHTAAWRLPAAAAPALIVAGDLNSDATDAVVRLLTSGVIEADDPDWLHGALNWAPSLDLPAAARDRALDAALGASVALGVSGADADVEAAWAHHLRHAEVADAGLFGAEVTSLHGARRIAHELHLLRRAIESLLVPATKAARARAGDAAAGDAAAGSAAAGSAAAGSAAAGSAAVGSAAGPRELAAAIVSDAAAGHSLLDSRALAAAEVARQLRLPLAMMVDGMSAQRGVPEASWYSRARTRLGKLTQRLIAAKAGLRAYVGSQAGASGAPVGYDGEAVARWASRAAGVRLWHPTRLESAYGLHTQPTHAVPGYANTLDWICVDSARLDIVGVAPLPPLEELTRDVAMPSVEWPSDHVSLCCDLEWRDPARQGWSSTASDSAATSRGGGGGGGGGWGGSPSRLSGPWAAEEPTTAGSWIWRT
jgi:hypothetical protein